MYHIRTYYASLLDISREGNETVVRTRRRTRITSDSMATSTQFDIRPSFLAQYCGTADYWSSLSTPRGLAETFFVTRVVLLISNGSPMFLRKIDESNIC